MGKIEMMKDLESKRNSNTPFLLSHSIWNIGEEFTAGTKLVWSKLKFGLKLQKWQLGGGEEGEWMLIFMHILF